MCLFSFCSSTMRKILLALRSAAVCALLHVWEAEWEVEREGRGRGRESERGSVVLLWYVCDASELVPPTPRRSQSPESWDLLDHWQQVIKYDGDGWRSGWQSGSGIDSYKVVTNGRENRTAGRRMSMFHLTEWWVWTTLQQPQQDSPARCTVSSEIYI